jgi:uncharacterized protein YdhG (YjbR/CyaY superfamily)
VDQWLEHYDNPQREPVAKVRTFVLGCDPAMTEAIKWQAPTFMQGKHRVLLPQGQEKRHPDVPPGAFLQDDAGLLEGDGEVSRVARFVDDADFEAKKPALQAVILAWIRDKG